MTAASAYQRPTVRPTIADSELVGVGSECPQCTIPIAFGDAVYLTLIEGVPRVTVPVFYVVEVRHFDCEDPSHDRVRH